MQFIFGLMGSYGERPSSRGPEWGESDHAIEISAKATEGNASEHPNPVYDTVNGGAAPD